MSETMPSPLRSVKDGRPVPGSEVGAVPPARYYTFTDVADRVDAVLGERPTESTLRAGAASAARGTNARVRITAGMPAPRPDHVDGRTVFSARAIDRWLSHHPRRRVEQVQRRLSQAPLARRGAAVACARAAGLSWHQIADALNAADHTTYSRQWAQQRWQSTVTRETSRT